MTNNEIFEVLAKHNSVLNIVKDTYIVTITLDKGWFMEKGDEKITIKQSPEDENTFFLMTKMGNGIGILIDHIKNTVKNNEELILKKELYKEKADELANLFVANSLEKLRTIKFVMDEVKIESENDVYKAVAETIVDEKVVEISDENAIGDEKENEKNKIITKPQSKTTTNKKQTAINKSQTTTNSMNNKLNLDKEQTENDSN